MRADNPYFMISVELLTVEKAIREANEKLKEGSWPPSAVANMVRIAQEKLSTLAYELTMAQSRYASREHNMFCPIRTTEYEIRDKIKKLRPTCSCKTTQECSHCSSILHLQKMVAELR